MGTNVDYASVDYFSEPSLIEDPEPYFDFLLARLARYGENRCMECSS